MAEVEGDAAGQLPVEQVKLGAPGGTERGDGRVHQGRRPLRGGGMARERCPNRRAEYAETIREGCSREKFFDFERRPPSQVTLPGDAVL